MSPAALADLTVAAHFLFVVFVVLGGLLALAWPRAAWLHLPALAWGAATEFLGIVCPLTHLENALRAEAGDARYSVGFVEHYLVPVVYPPDLTRDVQIVLGCLLVAFNIGVYWLVWRRHSASRPGSATPPDRS